MTEVYVVSDDITVLGGPTKRDVSIGIGNQGNRGSNIFVGSGNPNSSSTIIPRTPQIFDMFINLALDDPEYLYLYQYLNQNGVTKWIRVLRLVPNTFLTNKQVAFINGSTTIEMPVSEVVALSTVGNYSASNFNVQHTVLNSNPVSSAVSIGEITTSSEIDINTGMYMLVLPITINAVEFDVATSSWSALTGPKIVELFITVV